MLDCMGVTFESSFTLRLQQDWSTVFVTNGVTAPFFMISLYNTCDLFVACWRKKSQNMQRFTTTYSIEVKHNVNVLTMATS